MTGNIKETDLNSIEILINTFLITYKDGIALNKLDSAYFELNGEHIPFKKYGFCTLVTLLSALPSVSVNGAWVNAIPTKKVMHIHKFVAEQNNKSSRRGNSYSQYRNSNYSNRNNNFGCYQPSRNFNVASNVHRWGPTNAVTFSNYNWDNHFTTNNWPRHENLRSNKSTNSYSPVKLSNPEQKTLHNPSKVNYEKLPIPLNKGTLTRLKIVMKSTTNGLSAAEIVKNYVMLFPEFKDDLDHKAMNHETMDSLFETAPTGLFSRMYSLHGEVRYNKGINVFPHNKLSDIDVGFQNETEILVTEKDQFKLLDLQTMLSNSKEMEVHVAEIYNPHRFYLNPANDKLDNLMKDIANTYSSHSKSSLKAHTVWVDLPVIVLLEDHVFYRAIIMDASDPQSIEVLIVDYGTISYVKKDDLYRMPIRLMDLPKQAFEARLNNVQPFNSNKWENNDAANWLLEHSSSKCRATFEEATSSCVSVVLYPLNETQSFNEAMVQAGLARSSVTPTMRTPLEKLASSLNASSLNGSKTAVNEFKTAPTHKKPIEIFSRDDLVQLKCGMAAPLCVAKMEFEAVANLDDCLNYIIKQREECLSALAINPENEDIFDYVQTIYSVIRQLRGLKEFNKQSQLN